MNEINVLKKRLLYTESYYLSQKKIIEERIKLLELRDWDKRIERQRLETCVITRAK